MKLIECVDKVLERNQMDKYGLFLKSQILNSIGNYEEAIKCCEQALDDKSINLAYGDFISPFALTIKGNSLCNLRKYNEAIECYEKGFRNKSKLSILSYMLQKEHYFSK